MEGPHESFISMKMNVEKELMCAVNLVTEHHLLVSCPNFP